MPSRLTAEQIFNEACEMQAAEREAYLKGACGNKRFRLSCSVLVGRSSRENQFRNATTR